MKSATRTKAFLTASALTALAACATTNAELGSADHPQAKKDTTAATAQGKAGEAALPPGVSAEDMQACMAAATPGKQHELLARDVGHWAGTETMWMSPEAPATTLNVTATLSPAMDGRFVKCEYSGEMPGMGAFHGLGYTGFDNVSQKLVATWMDSMSTGIMVGEGTISTDTKTLTLNYHYNCPITHKTATMRQMEHLTGDNTMTLDFWGDDPHTGKEFKMMHIEMTRQSS